MTNYQITNLINWCLGFVAFFRIIRLIRSIYLIRFPTRYLTKNNSPNNPPPANGTSAPVLAGVVVVVVVVGVGVAVTVDVGVGVAVAVGVGVLVAVGVGDVAVVFK